MLDALRTRLNLVLLAALVLAVALLIALLAVGTDAVGVTSKADAEEQRIQAVTAAARQELETLYTVDYRKLEPWAASLLHGAGGEFLSQLQASIETNKAAIFQNKIISTINLVNIGVRDLQADSAVLFAYSTSQEQSTLSKQLPASDGCPAATICHHYVFRLGMVRTPDGWRVSALGRA